MVITTWKLGGAWKLKHLEPSQIIHSVIEISTENPPLQSLPASPPNCSIFTMLVKIVGLLAISLLITGTVHAIEPSGEQMCSCVCPAGHSGTSTNDTNWTEPTLPSDLFGKFELHHGRGFDQIVSWLFNSTHNKYHANMTICFKRSNENSFDFTITMKDREQTVANINLKNRTELQLQVSENKKCTVITNYI